VGLSREARELGYQSSSTPFFIWSCWVGARVLFGESKGWVRHRLDWCGADIAVTDTRLVHAFLSHKPHPDQDFDEIVLSLKDQAQYWSLASTLNLSPAFSPFRSLFPSNHYRYSIPISPSSPRVRPLLALLVLAIPVLAIPPTSHPIP
jgi:hypothetical protein